MNYATVVKFEWSAVSFLQPNCSTVNILCTFQRKKERKVDSWSSNNKCVNSRFAKIRFDEHLFSSVRDYSGEVNERRTNGKTFDGNYVAVIRKLSE